MKSWTAICSYDVLLPERGVAALVDGVQIAVFRLVDGGVVAIGNHDPVSRTNVMSRGLVGTSGAVTYVASPMFKQRYDVASGRCLDDAAMSVTVYSARAGNGVVEVLAVDQASDRALAS
ncbi:MAG: nitrite reductase small subunit [Frankiaceae bacterium]|nr:nitrite reductase small subunit [Frankiaceae bacterium]